MVMKNIEKEELKEFAVKDKQIYEKVKNLNVDNFVELWVSEKEHRRHLQKRLDEKVIQNEQDYINKIKECVLNPDSVFIKKYKSDYKRKINRWDRIYYKNAYLSTHFLKTLNNINLGTEIACID